MPDFKGIRAGPANRPAVRPKRAGRGVSEGQSSLGHEVDLD